MNRLQIKRWMVALMAGGGISVNTPVRAEVIYDSVDLSPTSQVVALGDASMRKQLCARKGVDGSCLDGRTSAKARLLAPTAPPDDPLPTEPPGLGGPLPPITLPPPVIDELPPVGQGEPLLPIAAPPNSIAVPEPGGLSLAVLGALLLLTVRRVARPRFRIARPAPRT